MTVDVEGTRAWAAENRACWETMPLFEREHGQAVQVGFELSLFARIPDMPDGDERRAAIYALWDRLQELAQSLAPLLGGEGRVEVDAFDAAGRLRPETQFAPEIMVQARLFQSPGSSGPLPAADREWLRPVEHRLVELGLRPRTW
jgi:hypothetical protein